METNRITVEAITNAKRHRRRGVVAILSVVSLWTLAAVLTPFVAPPLEDARLPARVYAFASLAIQAFRLHVGLGSLLIAIAFLVRRHRRVAFVMAALGLFGIAPEMRHALPARGDDPSIGTPIRLLSLNNERLTTNSEAVAAAIIAERPDLIAFQQFAATTDDALGELYRHRLSFPSPPFQGVALYSRWPARVTRAPDFRDPTHGRVLEAEVDVDGRSVRVIVVHLTSPRSVARLAANRTELATLLDRLGPVDRPTIVVGDFNAPFASQSVDAMRAAGLAHADDLAGAGVRWTWQLFDGVPFARIDHAFVSPHFGVADSRVLAGVGSDHLPIVVDLRLP